MVRVSPAAPSCHGESAPRIAPAGSPVVAFVGAPNVGKSTLFNTLTGSKRTMGNWPGTSVEIGRGAWPTTRGPFDAIDFPGAYSLDPQSPDEELTRDLLIDAPIQERPDAVLVVADASALTRSLYITAQVREHPYPVVVALTMLDVARRRGIRVDTTALEKHLGSAVVAIDPRKGTGLNELEDAVGRALEHADQAAPRERDLPTGEADEFTLADERFAWIDAAVEASTVHAANAPVALTSRIDSVALHPILGPLLFLAVMWGVFELTTTIAAPLQDGLDQLVSGPVSDGARWLLAALRIDHPVVTGFLVDGLIAGVGALLTFVPLMAIMFLLLALLEDSGYMARAAVVSDRAMRAIGLPGKAFLPLLVGFGCNVPAIAATRVLPDAKQRILTSLLIPFTSCSARLTVYVMLASTFFPDRAGTVVFAMYVISVALVIVVGLLLRTTLWRTMGSSPLVLDLPPYQAPVPRIIASVTWVKLRAFLQTAAGIIVVCVTLVFLLQATPAPGADGRFGAVAPQDSLYAASAEVITPVFAPAGFDDWRTSGALVTGFVAKEAVISSWAQTYALEDPSAQDAEQQGRSQLGRATHHTFETTSGGYTTAAIWAFMIFILAYTPCVATLAAQKREIGWGWTLFGIALQLTIAWALAVAVFQILSRVL